MDVRYITATEVERHTADDLADLLKREDGVLWADVPTWDEQAKAALTDVFRFHPRAIQDCAQRNPVPKVHIYVDHHFLVLHAPQAGAAGHVHYLELDQFVGPRYLVTVHGPVNAAVDPQASLSETRAVLERIEAGRQHPSTSEELSYLLVTALANRIRDHIGNFTRQVWALEQQVTAGHLGNPEEFLEELFRTRHGLLSVRTMAVLSHEIYGRMVMLTPKGSEQRRLYKDVTDQFDHLQIMADGQKEYLQGTIEFYQARTNTKMTIAAERLAVIAAVTLPITALSSILGMNVIVNDRTLVGPLVVTLVIMAALSWLLLIWAKRQGWW